MERIESLCLIELQTLLDQIGPSFVAYCDRMNQWV